MTLRNSQPSYLTALAFVCLAFVLPARLDAQESSADLMNRAYQIQSTNPNEAARLLKQVFEKDPSNISARRQLGYLYLNQSDYEGALEQFQASEKIHSSDTIKLQIAYILGSLH